MCSSANNKMNKARFPLPELTTRVDGRTFPPAELTGRVARLSTRPMLTGNGKRSHVNSGRQLG